MYPNEIRVFKYYGPRKESVKVLEEKSANLKTD